MRFAGIVVAATLIALVWHPRVAHAQQEIETETARPIGQGHLELGTAYEFQYSSNGEEHAIPFAFEYGLTNRLELLVEPVAFTRIHPSPGNGPVANGIGDLEVTMFGLALHEQTYTPAVSVGVELKAPTARNLSIGTGKADLAFYLIGSKQLGPVDVHVNAGYTIIGKPMNVTANNIWSGAVAGILPIGTRWEAFAEIYGNTAASPDGESGDAGGVVLTPELAGGEIVGAAGAGYHLGDYTTLSLGFSYDNNRAFQVRPGVTISMQAL